MKNHFSVLAKLVAVAVCGLSLGSCNRAEYAMLPKGASYHGVTRVSTPVPAAPSAAATETPAAEAPATVVSEPVAAPAAVASAAPAPAKAQSKTTAAKPAEAVAAKSLSTPSATATTSTAPTPKLNAVQRLALNKVARKLDKAMHKATARQQDNTASTARGGIDGNLRIGIILLLVGLLLGLINGLIGTIVAIIGLIFIVLWLLDQL
ncbi:hypothetical protein [Hymenobacter negativus]|uniref:Translation initiation factor 2 n=1 Tax=Hymenobacter negativus TaxID=2795026 RepID=A0ABS3QND1_9BACT|nr:hypothetical protein [Hymenobacter negativus]MBO2012779.1 hypothetical protein [Hymenobacter negativus]